MQPSKIATLVIVVALVVFSGFAAACKGASSQSTAVNPAPPTPGAPPPGSRIQTVDDAIKFASDFISGQGGSMLSAAHIQSVAYVQTTVSQAANFLGGYVPDRMSLLPANTTAWLFVTQGYYGRYDRFSEPPAAQGTLWVLAVQGGTTMQDIAKTPLDLTQLGTPTVIPPGQVPDIDAVRGPLTIQVGAPSLASGTVRVPINATNPFNASLVPYTGVNIHLRWNPSVFTFSALDTTGTVLPSPLCVSVISQDTDGGGVVIGCASLGGQTAATGLLVTVVLTPAATGCSALHLFTYVKQDHGDSTTGTYVLNAFSNQPLPVGYVDGSANVSGQTCTP